MAKINGVCKNIDEDCELALKKEVQQVEKSAPFVCEECGKPLMEVATKKPGGGPPKILIIIIIAVIILGGGGYLAYSMLSKPATEITEGDTTGGDEITDPIPPAEPEETEIDEPIVEDPQPEETENTETEESEPLVTIENGDIDAGNGTGTISFHYGKYTGEIKNFKANGQGSLVFYKQYRLSSYDKQERQAERQDVISGQFKDNNLTNGKWFDKDKKQKGTVLTGELGVPQ